MCYNKSRAAPRGIAKKVDTLVITKKIAGGAFRKEVVLMTIKQLSIFVENKPGRLSEITEILEKNQIDIRALSVADTTNFGILRVIVNNPDKAQEALKDAGFTVSLTNVIAIGVDDKPGGLSQVMKCMAAAGISVEYMYAFISKEEKSAYVIIRVEDNAAATEVLKANGVPILTSAEVYDM